ncbi:MAG: thiamine phosphate synthase [Verrucomicrobia bacterium]|nr:thiamine phosphate synthase [Verrucomicrobiota bacterium]
MKLVVISPESDEPREHAVLAALFSAGLARYHVRKPYWSQEKLSTWLNVVPTQWRSRLVLHQCHELAVELGCGGVHFKEVGRVIPNPPEWLRRVKDNAPYLFTSRSCHDIQTLGTALGNYDAVFFSPIFPSISKLGYRPTVDPVTVAERLSHRTNEERKTEVIALGGITPATVARCDELGFDGVAVLGALWQSAEPVKVFDALQQSLSSHVA